MTLEVTQNRLAGYAFLIEKYRLNVLPNWHTSSVSLTGTLRSAIQDGQVNSVYPQSYWPGDRTEDHLEFALKYDGVNMGILSAILEAVTADEITSWIISKPTGKYARRIWFLYEFLTGRKLSLPDLTKGNYIELLEADRYYTIAPGRRLQRQRVIDNLLGGPCLLSRHPAHRQTDRHGRNRSAPALRRDRDRLSPGTSQACLELSLQQGDQVLIRDRAHQAKRLPDREIHRSCWRWPSTRTFAKSLS